MSEGSDVVFLTCPTFVLGQPFPLGEGVVLDDEAKSTLVAEGVHGHRAFDSPDSTVAWRLAAEQAEAGAGPFWTLFCSSLDEPLHSGQQERERLVAAGGCATITLAGNGCAELATALVIGRSLVLDRQMPAVIVATFDGPPEDRYLRGDASLQSDAATAFTLLDQRPAEPHFELLGIAVRTSMPDGGSSGRLRATGERVAAATAAALRDAALTIDDVDHLLTHSYGDSVREFLAVSSGLGVQLLVAERGALVSHVPTGDIAVTLALFEAGQLGERRLQAGDVIVAVFTGPDLSATAVLRYAP